MSTINLGTFVVRNANGSVDTEATLVKFAELVAEWDRQVGEAQAAVAGAVSAIFDQYRGATLNKAYIVNEVARRMGATPDTFSKLEKGVVEYIAANSQGEVADNGTEQYPGSVFVTKPGKRGGTYRRADR